MVDSEDILKNAKLLYRAGAWLSLIDDDGGKDSEILEREAMRETLRGFLNEPDYITVVTIIESALSHQISWKKWSDKLADFPKELQAEASSMPLPLKQCLHELAYSVATRYCERNIFSAAISGLTGSLGKFFAPHKAGLKSTINISAAEKHALNEIAEVLHLTHRML